MKREIAAKACACIRAWHQLIVTARGLKAIGIETVVAQTLAGLRAQGALHQPNIAIDGAKTFCKATAKTLAQRIGAKQAMLIAKPKAEGGATFAATGWQAHSLCSAISGELGKKMGRTIALKSPHMA